MNLTPSLILKTNSASGCKDMFWAIFKNQTRHFFLSREMCIVAIPFYSPILARLEEVWGNGLL